MQEYKSTVFAKTARSCWRLHFDIEKYFVLFSVYVRLHQQFNRTNFIELPSSKLLQINMLSIKKYNLLIVDNVFNIMIIR